MPLLITLLVSVTPGGSECLYHSSPGIVTVGGGYKSLSVVTSLLVVTVSVFLHLREENLMVHDVGDAALLLLVDRELEVSWSLDPRASHIELAVSEDLIIIIMRKPTYFTIYIIPDF